MVVGEWGVVLLFIGIGLEVIFLRVTEVEIVVTVVEEGEEGKVLLVIGIGLEVLFLVEKEEEIVAVLVEEEAGVAVAVFDEETVDSFVTGSYTCLYLCLLVWVNLGSHDFDSFPISENRILFFMMTWALSDIFVIPVNVLVQLKKMFGLE